MTIELDRALRRKCDADERLRLLQAQWDYDQRLVGQALLAVGQNFPHYSKHDASHSDTILLQITRLLGPRVEQISATDLWLILEAAYWHDSGMIIDAEVAQRWWDNEDFKQHLANMRSGGDAMLAEAARVVSEKFEPRSQYWPLEVRKAVTLVLADYGRLLHATRSGEAVRHPMLQGIHSPRALIPHRLFDWLAEIAVCHGRSLEEVMSLPYEEGGLGTETCHPRFVAFMLRIGDLLDLDNGRFCPVMSRSIGTLPASSLDHVAKHASIRHFSVSPEMVSVTAVCESLAGSDPYGAYEAASSWLDWLRQELRHLASNWVAIAPPAFGGAPSLGVIEAVLKGYISLESGKKPRFSVDESAFLNLVRSNNLYRSRYAWVRELLANAEDATLIRVHQEGRLPALPERDEPTDDPFGPVREELRGNEVTVKLRQDGDFIHVSIRDQGTGISRADLPYMLTIGSSRKNPERRSASSRMPEHVRPTGSFGIGLQSVFMPAAEVDISSMHFKTRDRLHIKIRRSNSAGPAVDLLREAPERSGVYIKELGEGEEPRTPGTLITFQIRAKDPLVDASDAPVDEALEDESRSLVRLDFDPIHAEQVGAEHQRLVAELKAQAKHMLACIRVNGELPRAPTERAEVRLFDGKTKLLFKFQEPALRLNPIDLSYRGSDVPSHNLAALPILRLQVDAEFGRASDVVAASRETLTPDGEQAIDEKLRVGLERVFKHYFLRLGQGEASNGRRQLAALFAKVYLREALHGVADADAWRGISLLNDDKGEGVTLREVVELTEIRVFEPMSNSAHKKTERPSGRWFTPALDIGTSSDDTSLRKDAFSVFQDVLLCLFEQSGLVGISETERRYCLTRQNAGAPASAQVEPSSNPVVDQLVRELKFLPALDTTLRVVWPEVAGYPHLQIKTAGSERFKRKTRLPGWVSNHGWLTHRAMVLPLEFCTPDTNMTPSISARYLREYVRWVSEHSEPVPGESEQERLKGIVRETEALVRLLHQKLGDPTLLDFDRRPFSLESALRMLTEFGVA